MSEPVRPSRETQGYCCTSFDLGSKQIRQRCTSAAPTSAAQSTCHRSRQSVTARGMMRTTNLQHTCRERYRTLLNGEAPHLFSALVNERLHVAVRVHTFYVGRLWQRLRNRRHSCTCSLHSETRDFC